MKRLNNKNIFKINAELKKKDLNTYQEQNTQRIDRIINKISGEDLMKLNFYMSIKMIRIAVDLMIQNNKRISQKSILSTLEILNENIKKANLQTVFKTHLAIEATNYLNHPTARKVI